MRDRLIEVRSSKFKNDNLYEDIYKAKGKKFARLEFLKTNLMVVICKEGKWLYWNFKG